jgi:hypothetical protein
MNSSNSAETDPFDGIINLIESGISAWVIAGQRLSELRQKYPDCYQRVMAKRPWLTVHTLKTLERIGNKEIYPYALLESGTSSKWIVGYPYDQQVDACTNGVDVLLYFKDGKPFHQCKALNMLSRQESKQVFGQTRLRTLEEQRPFLDPVKNSTRNHAQVKTVPFNQKVQTSENVNQNHGGFDRAPSRKESVGFYKISIYHGDVTFEKVSAAPPDCPVIELHTENGKQVAHVRLVETLVGLGELTPMERQWREMKESFPVNPNSDD